MATMDWLMFVCIFAAVGAIPFAFHQVPYNHRYGLQSKFLRSRPEAWYRANAFAGRATLVAAIFSALLLHLLPVERDDSWTREALVLAPMALSTLIAWVYVRHLRETLERR